MVHLRRTLEARPSLAFFLALFSMMLTCVVLFVVYHFQTQNDAKRQADTAAKSATAQAIVSAICPLAEAYTSLPVSTAGSVTNTKTNTATIVKAWKNISILVGCR